MKIKQLEWLEPSETAWYAKAPIAWQYASGGVDSNLTIYFEEGKYWPYHSLESSSFSSLEDAKRFYQKRHEEYVMSFFEE